MPSAPIVIFCCIVTVGSGRLVQDAVDWAEAVVRCNLVLTASWGGRYDTPVDSPTRAWSATSRRSKLYWAQGQAKTSVAQLD